ncbi:hypothetical protein BSKO_05883 [Bryopsis sp. KO-2023]|nr:hypothetical protein BSKO_05883 [Bryopsis sp. KO-2023]
MSGGSVGNVQAPEGCPPPDQPRPTFFLGRSGPGAPGVDNQASQGYPSQGRLDDPFPKPKFTGVVYDDVLKRVMPTTTKLKQARVHEKKDKAREGDENFEDELDGEDWESDTDERLQRAIDLHGVLAESDLEEACATEDVHNKKPQVNLSPKYFAVLQAYVDAVDGDESDIRRKGEQENILRAGLGSGWQNFLVRLGSDNFRIKPNIRLLQPHSKARENIFNE